jgi:hypothetical protein
LTVVGVTVAGPVVVVEYAGGDGKASDDAVEGYELGGVIAVAGGMAAGRTVAGPDVVGYGAADAGSTEWEVVGAVVDGATAVAVGAP